MTWVWNGLKEGAWGFIVAAIGKKNDFVGPRTLTVEAFPAKV